MHYGPEMKKHRINSYPIIHCPTSEGVSEVSGRVKQSVRKLRSKQTSEECERTSKLSEWPSTSVFIFGCSGPQRARDNLICLFTRGESPARDESFGNVDRIWMLYINDVY